MEIERGMWRGKDVDTGEWRYGWRVPGPEPERVCLVWAEPEEYVSEKGHSWLEFDGYYEVDPSTLGEYTGIQDKNGEPIFEGDILAHWLGGEVISKRTVYYDTCHTSYNLPYASNKELCDYEVIGNKWDNPDLLGGA